MIYLFEDRKDRMKESFDIENYSNLITDRVFVSGNTEIFFKDISDAEIIILHKSYAFTENFTVDVFKNWCKENRKLLVIFSGGLTNGIVNNYYAESNSGDLYQNLPEFLDYYSKNNTINLPLLIFGNKYLFSQVKHFQIEYLTQLLNPNYIFDEDDFEGILTAKELKEDKNVLFKFLSETHRGSEVINSQIQKFVDKYADY
ncbi:hypothetical protein [Chryseobacterium sp. RR2-3-20]|uniref:hypothetical protein n=1 Tax=Chryseobacterium sp. RR2-3-20 TaxID=2787626 RepID=UPI001ADF5B21|nr:hypothetical protein [Chryseobacterium sp. RR2-3-20]